MLRDPENGNEIFKYHKACGKKVGDIESAMFWLNRIFLKNIHSYMHDKPRPQPKFNEKALQHCIDWLDELLVFLKEESHYDVKHTSIFILVDHVNDDCIIKLIDFSYVEEYYDTTKRDVSFIFGCETLR